MEQGQGGQGAGQQGQQEEEQEKRVALDYDQRVRVQAILGCQHIKEVEQQLVRAPPPMLGAGNHPEAQAVRAGILAAAAAIVRSFSNVIQLLNSFPGDSNPPPVEQSAHSRGLMNAMAQLEAGSRGRSHSPNNPESPMSTAGNSETTPPPSPNRMVSGLPPMPSPPLSSSPCHTPMSGMSDGSPVSNLNVHNNLSSLGILDMEATSRQGNSNDTDADPSAAAGAGTGDQRPAPPKKRKFLPRWNIKLRATGGESGNEAPPDDGFTWRKYGQKDILGSRFPRSYYRCTHKNELGCPAIKYVQRCDDDPGLFDVTYRGEHSCLAQIPPNPWFPFAGVPSPMHNLAQQPFPPATEPGPCSSSSSILLNNAGGIQVGPSLPFMPAAAAAAAAASNGGDCAAVPPRVPFPLTTTGTAAGSNLLLRPAFPQSPVITPRFGMPYLDPRSGVKAEQQPYPPRMQPADTSNTGSVFPPNAVSLLSMLLQNAVKAKEQLGNNPVEQQCERDKVNNSGHQHGHHHHHHQQGLASQGFSQDMNAALPRSGSSTMDGRGAYVSSWVDSLPSQGYLGGMGGGDIKDEADEMTVESSAESLPSPASSDAVSSVFRAPRALQPNTAGLSVVAPPRNPMSRPLQQVQAGQGQGQQGQGQQGQGQGQGQQQQADNLPFNSIGLYLDSPGSQQQIANAMSDYESYAGGNSMLFGAPQPDQSKFM